MATIKIKTVRGSYDKDKGFKGVEGTLIRLKGDHQRCAIGGWYGNEEGRVVHGGPMVRGPQAYAFGVCTVISDPPTPWVEPIEVELGDVLVIASHRYRVATNWTGRDIILELIK